MMQNRFWKKLLLLCVVVLFAAGSGLSAEAATKKIILESDGGGTVTVYDVTNNNDTVLSSSGTTEKTFTVGAKFTLKYTADTAGGFTLLTYDVLDEDGKVIGRNSSGEYTMPSKNVIVKPVFRKRVMVVSATGFIAPAAGKTPIQKTALTPGSASYTIDSLEWFYGDTLTEDKEFSGTGTFDAHKKWRAEITFTTGYPNGFTGNPNLMNWRLNGAETLVDLEASKKKVGQFEETGMCTVVFLGAFFDANGGTGTMQPVFAVKGEEITLPESTFTAPEGKEFNGWDLGSVGSKISLNDITSVKAQWKATVHTISFDANGGTGTMADITGVEYGTSYKLPANTFTAPAGKEFDKWEQGAVGENIVIKGNVALKAIWKDISSAAEPAAAEPTVTEPTSAVPTASEGTPAKEQETTPADTTGMSDASYVYFGESAVTPKQTKSASTVNKKLLQTKSEEDVAESSFGLLRAWGKVTSDNNIKLSWKKVKGAKKYIIYGNKCGKNRKYKKKKEVTGTSYTRTNCKDGTYYKFIVAAVKGKKVIAVSKTIHVVTDGGKYGNVKKIKLDKSTLKLKKGKSYKLKVTVTKPDKPMKNHRKVAFESSDIRVATVSSTGKITAVGKGSCYVYAFAQNGRSARVKVKVS